jgi:hypothetical protein
MDGFGSLNFLTIKDTAFFMHHENSFVTFVFGLFHANYLL